MQSVPHFKIVCFPFDIDLSLILFAAVMLSPFSFQGATFTTHSERPEFEADVLVRITAAYDKLPQDEQENKYSNFDTQEILELKKHLKSSYVR